MLTFAVCWATLLLEDIIHRILLRIARIIAALCQLATACP
ncbi:hypothetical protein SAMCCGM7_Ch0714 [Sinorhizobium americanum CCGM7]|nr:hypothetical protein SAMCCGM7_Ch0714 [Sinorhizobium americanum CCGM7]